MLSFLSHYGTAPLPDPCDEHCPEAFKQQARQILLKMDGRPQGWTTAIEPDEGLRRIMLKFIADFANWDLAANHAYLDVSRALVKAAHGEEPPLVVDPFAGGGSIPLEALRLGCEAFASDLNPVACLILKVMLEDIPRHGPELAEELRRIGGEIKREAEQELADLYPADPDGATPIAYLWARTVRCEAPNCGAEIPLMRSFYLCKKPKRKWALRHRVERSEGEPPSVEFEVFEPKADGEVRGGTVTRARATCLCCGAVLPPERVRAQLAAQRSGADVIFDAEGNRTGGARMTAVVRLKTGQAGRHYRLPTDADYEAVRRSQARLADIIGEWKRGGKQGLCPVPDEPLPPIGTLGFRVQRYGMLQWGDLFTARQKVALATFGSALQFAGTIARPLSLSIGKLADLANAVCPWEPIAECPRNVMSIGRLKPAWDFAEGVAVSEASGSFGTCVENLANGVESLNGVSSTGQSELAAAQQSPLPSETAAVWFTDPPYYDAIPYADLSDFFFSWYRRIVPEHVRSDPFDSRNRLTPKVLEAVHDETKQVDGRAKDRIFLRTPWPRRSWMGNELFGKMESRPWYLLTKLLRGGRPSCPASHAAAGPSPGLGQWRRSRPTGSVPEIPLPLPPASTSSAARVLRMPRSATGPMCCGNCRTVSVIGLSGFRARAFEVRIWCLPASGRRWRFSVATAQWRLPKVIRSACLNIWRRSGRWSAAPRCNRCWARHRPACLPTRQVRWKRMPG